jgi:hypothetical protein
MVPAIRKAYNQAFSDGAYQAFIQETKNLHAGSLEFRLAETPVFCDKTFTEKILAACEHIVDVILHPSFNEMSAKAIPSNLRVPGHEGRPHFIAFDFGVCINEHNELEPQLIEMQGFPTLFAYQAYYSEITRKHFQIPDHYSSYLNGYEKESYLQLLKEIIVGPYRPEEVILLEVLPHQQKTRIDFYCTEKALGIPIVCLTELIKEGNSLFYMKDNEKKPVRRIYNRLIFDDLQQQNEAIRKQGDILFQDLDVEWVTHPNWFYRISKYTLPFIKHKYVPETFFLDQVKELPTDLENYVLKPLFSFAGQGVIIDLTPEDIKKVTDPQNWILQRKVKYADVIETPDIPAKAEIRIFYFWPEGASRPVATHNLGRLSKGKMIGVRYNKDKEWVGGTIIYFEQ